MLDGRVERRFAAGDSLDGGADLLRAGVLGQVAARAGAERADAPRRRRRTSSARWPAPVPRPRSAGGSPRSRRIRGIRRSINTTSGTCSAASASACSPSAAVDQLDPVEQAEQRPEPVADDALVVGEQDPYRRQPQLHPEPVVRRPRDQAAAEQLGALAHARQPVAVPGVASPAPTGTATGAPVSRTVDEEPLPSGSSRRTPRPARRAVAAHVGERLLGGAVQREPGLRAEWRAGGSPVDASARPRRTLSARSARPRGSVSPRSAAIAWRASSARGVASPWARSIAVDDLRVGAAVAGEQPRRPRAVARTRTASGRARRAARGPPDRVRPGGRVGVRARDSRSSAL